MAGTGDKLMTAEDVKIVTDTCVKNSGGTITGAVSITDDTASSSKTTGALTVTGGVGVGGTVYADGFNGPLTGTASQATADADGNTISSTYVKTSSIINMSHGGTGIDFGMLEGSTWAELYAQLSKIQNNSAVSASFSTAATSLLSGNAISAGVQGMIGRFSTSTFQFMTVGDSSSTIYTWRVTGWTSASATPTVGTIYSYDNSSKTACKIFIPDSANTFAKIYPYLNVLSNNETAVILIGGTVSSILTANKSSNGLKGIVQRVNASAFDFMVAEATALQNIYTWRISDWSSASATPTIGTVYGHAGETGDLLPGKCGLFGNNDIVNGKTLVTLGAIPTAGIYIVFITAMASNTNDVCSVYSVRYASNTFYKQSTIHEGTNAAAPILQSDGTIKRKDGTTITSSSNYNLHYRTLRLF